MKKYRLDLTPKSSMSPASTEIDVITSFAGYGLGADIRPNKRKGRITVFPDHELPEELMTHLRQTYIVRERGKNPVHSDDSHAVPDFVDSCDATMIPEFPSVSGWGICGYGRYL